MGSWVRMNPLYLSNQAQRVPSLKKPVASYIIPAMCLRDMKSNELEMQLEFFHQ